MTDTPKSPANFGKYQVRARLDTGGFGCVYEVDSGGAPAALKILHEEASTDEARERFLREAEALKLLEHPHIVPFLDSGVLDDGRPFFVMELLEGETLEKRLARVGKLGVEETLSILQQIADALTFAHERNVVHRDIKASNVFLRGDSEFNAILLDFGVAKMEELKSLTTSRHTIGTPTTMSPEQVRGGATDQRTDVYGMGNLAFLMLTGRLPFAHDVDFLLQHMHLHAPPPKPSQFANNLSSDTDKVILRALQKSMDARYQSVDTFLNDLRASLEGRPLDDSAEESAAGEGGAVAIMVEAVFPADAEESLGDSDMADVEDLLDIIFEKLGAAGFRVALETGNSGLLVRDLPEDVEDLLDSVRQIAQTLELTQQDPFSAKWNLCVHACPSEGPSAPDIERVGDWAPTDNVVGLCFTEGGLRGLGVDGDELSDHPGYYRLQS